MKLTYTDAGEGGIIITEDDNNGRIVATIPAYLRDKIVIARLFCAAPAMLEALKAAEWSVLFGDDNCCPACGEMEEDGHNYDCPIGNAIKLAEEG